MSADASPIKLSGWALILGASSGFGAATSLALARAGCDIFGVHLDRTGHPAERRSAWRPRSRRSAARRASSTSTPPTRKAGRRWRARWSACSRERDEMGQLRVMLHSLAFGTLKLFIADPMKEAVTKVADGHDARRDGAQPRLLGAGDRRPRADGARRTHLRHDLVGRHPRASPLRARCRRPRPRSSPISASSPPSSRPSASPPTRSVPASPTPRRARRSRTSTTSQGRRRAAQPAPPAHHHRGRGARHRRPLPSRHPLDHRQRHRAWTGARTSSGPRPASPAPPGVLRPR